MSQAIIPRSDQWNADDFLSGPKTFKISDVKIRGGHEQPVSISVEGSDKVYRPCKSMSRVLVNCWGPDASKYIGRSLTLYADPSVMWGGMKVGGIRIAFLSDITETITMALTTTRATRKPFTVRPLVTTAMAKSDEPSANDILRLGNMASAKGISALRAFWTGLSKPEKEALGGAAQLTAWKAIAEAADKSVDDFDDQTSSPAAATPVRPNDPGREPAPDPQPIPESAPPSLSGSVSSPTRTQAGAEQPLAPAAVSAPAPPSLPPSAAYDDPDSPEAVEADRKARVEAIKIDGAANAGKGEAALNNYLEELVASGERSMIENATVREWRKMAREVKR
jgi:hypothetical protein